MAQIPEFKDFMPGLEFFQTLLRGAGMPSQFANWVAPTLDVEELEQRITDLKAVLGWLETHTRMTQNMIQALEVQRMTVQALKTMNVDMQAFAKGMVAEPSPAEREAPEPQQAQAEPAAPLFDPMQWWNTMTQQFTELANQALQEGGPMHPQSTTTAAPVKMPAARPPAAKKTANKAAKKAATKPRAATGARKTGTGAKPAAKRGKTIR